MADSGSGSGNNRFASTCAGVRQYYMMERNRQVQMGDLVVVGSSSFQPQLQQQLSPPVPVVTGPAGAWESAGTSTLPLFPIPAGSESSDEIIFIPEEPKATLTIIYQGQVANFHNFPANKARELMQMAGSVTENAPEKGVMTTVQGKATENSDEAWIAGSSSMTPIARKLTLERFLRKRKNRIASTDDLDQNQDASPWKKRDSAGASSPAEEVPDDASWLRL